MAKILKTTGASGIAMLDAHTALINVGGAGTIEVYDDTGVIPNDPDDVTGASILLGTLTFSATSFANAVAEGTASSKAIANTITQDSSADASGTALWARIKSGAGNTVFDCNVGEAVDDAVITLDVKTIIATGIIRITAFTLSIPNG